MPGLTKAHSKARTEMRFKGIAGRTIHADPGAHPVFQPKPLPPLADDTPDPVVPGLLAILNPGSSCAKPLRLNNPGDRGLAPGSDGSLTIVC